MTTAKTMAEVLAEHQIHWARKDHPTEDRVDFVATCSKCGPLAYQTPDKHRALALSAAGFGLVTDTKAEALEEAAEALDLPGSDATGYYASEQDSGYREAERHAEDWLRNRAANLRASS